MPVIPGKPTSASRITLSHIMSAHDTNLLGTVHGGVVMKLVDDAAGAVAGRHSEGPAVTGPLEALAMVAAGRRDALRQLSGSGLPRLDTRLTTLQP